MEFLVGNTGFVGSNIAACHFFDGTFHSTNIEEAFFKNPDLLVYSAVPAEMFLANQNPEKDKLSIQNAIENIKKINPKHIVLISTIAVYKNPINVNEDSQIEVEGLSPYGKNRYELEKWVEEYSERHNIIRLPALFGKNLKKNFIYDFIHRIPSMLKEEKWKELEEKDKQLSSFYIKQENGYYKCKLLNTLEELELRKRFEKLNFSALFFTDSRGEYQYYNLQNLWSHIEFTIKNEIPKLNLAVEPISISELYQELTGKVFNNHLNRDVPKYDYRSKYAEMLKGKNGYFFSKEKVIEDIKKFVREEMEKR